MNPDISAWLYHAWCLITYKAFAPEAGHYQYALAKTVPGQQLALAAFQDDRLVYAGSARKQGERFQLETIQPATTPEALLKLTDCQQVAVVLDTTQQVCTIQPARCLDWDLHRFAIETPLNGARDIISNLLAKPLFDSSHVYHLLQCPHRAQALQWQIPRTALQPIEGQLNALGLAVVRAQLTDYATLNLGLGSLAPNLFDCIRAPLVIGASHLLTFPLGKGSWGSPDSLHRLPFAQLADMGGELSRIASMFRQYQQYSSKHPVEFLVMPTLSRQAQLAQLAQLTQLHLPNTRFNLALPQELPFPSFYSILQQ